MTTVTPLAAIPMQSDESKPKVTKPYHEMTAAERLTSRIAKNRKSESDLRQNSSYWSLNDIVAQLNSRKQRASYGAVAEVASQIARGLMSRRTKCHADSWVVASTGPRRGWPTDYDTAEIHPDCLRQIHDGKAGLIENGEALRRWLKR